MSTSSVHDTWLRCSRAREMEWRRDTSPYAEGIGDGGSDVNLSRWVRMGSGVHLVVCGEVQPYEAR